MGGAASWEIDQEKLKTEIDVTVSAYFGLGVAGTNDGYYLRNQVFPKENFAPFMCALQKLKKAGLPTVHRSTQKVMANSWWGIKGGYELDLIITYAEKSEVF